MYRVNFRGIGRGIARLAVGLVVAAVATLAVAPGQANAGVVDACSTSHGAPRVTYVCVQAIDSSGLWINKGGVSHAPAATLGHEICGFKGRLTGTLNSGAAFSKDTATNTGCALVRGERQVTINQNFRHGSKFCGRFFHNGAWAPGTPCLTIER